MTDRYHSLTVVLQKDIREDDAPAIMNAIGMIRGVAAVDGCVANVTTHMAEERARRDLAEKVLSVLRGGGA